MSQTIQIPDSIALILEEQAAMRGMSLEAWVGELALEHSSQPQNTRGSRTRAAAEGILGLHRQVLPDPEGWSLRDYVSLGWR